MPFNKRYLGGPVALGGGGAQGQFYVYDTTDAPTTVIGAGYFAEMGAGADPTESRGMSKGDLVLVRIFDTLPAKTTFYSSELYEVVSIDADGDVTIGLPGGSAAVTATADGLTTGLIPPGASNVIATSAGANNIVTLPVPAPGKGVRISIGATGCEIRSLTGTTINAVAFPNELALAANSYAVFWGISA